MFHQLSSTGLELSKLLDYCYLSPSSKFGFHCLTRLTVPKHGSTYSTPQTGHRHLQQDEDGMENSFPSGFLGTFFVGFFLLLVFF